jgi:hypothetical protein
MSKNEVSTVESDNKEMQAHAQSVEPQQSQEMMMFTALNSAIEKGMSPDVLEKMLDMQLRVMDRQNEQAFNDAMRLAQSEMPAVVANADNKQTRSKYPKLERIVDVCAPHYIPHGFSCSFDTEDTTMEDCIRVTCMVSHSAGHTRKYHLDVPMDMTGPKGELNKTRTHGMISAVTYGQSRLMRMIWNVRVIDDPEDDDGNAAGPVECITEQQAADLALFLEEVKVPEPEFLKRWKCKSLELVPKAVYPLAINQLENRRKRMQEAGK